MYFQLIETPVSALTEPAATLHRRGEALANAGHYEMALEQFQQVLEQQPTCQTAWVFRAVLLLHLERYEEALASCDRALTLCNSNSEAWLFRGVALQRLKRYQQAYESYNLALRNAEEILMR